MFSETIGEDPSFESSRRNQAICFGFAVAVHALAFLWNPAILHSSFTPTHDFVTVDVVDQSSTPGAPEEAAPAPKNSLMDTLKDMLMKPKSDEIAHVAQETPAERVAAPNQPALQEKQMPHSFVASAFQPKSNSDDLAQSNPNAINMTQHNMPLAPNTPSLQAKSFSGIQSRQLPFQVGSDQIAGGADAGATAIPIAVGNGASKDALNYRSPALTDSGKHFGIHPLTSGTYTGDTPSSLGAGAPQTIALSGTGGTGNAPTGAPSGAVLQNRAGTGMGAGGFGAGLHGRNGSGIGGGISGLPSEVAQLDEQSSEVTKTAAAAHATKNGFQLEGPLNNRPIMKKVIPQYPAWAEEQGIIGSVRLYFTVTPDGTVRPNIRVVKTTGYPQLDQLGIDALKQWQFGALSNGDSGTGEWGIITFNFSLSS